MVMDLEAEYNLIGIQTAAVYERKMYNHSFPYSNRCIRLMLSRCVEKNSEKERQLNEAIDRLNSNLNENDERDVDIIIGELKDCPQKVFGDRVEDFQLRYARTQEEKEKFKVHVENEKLCFEDGTPVDSYSLFVKTFGRTPDEDDALLASIGGPFAEITKKSAFSCFVVDKDDNLYITPYRISTSHHNFLTNDEGVKIAGLVLMKEGKIYYLSNLSGHYRPEASRISKFLIPKLISLSNGKCDVKDIFSEGFDFDKYIFPRDPNKIIERIQYRGIEFVDGDRGNRQNLELRRSIKSQVGLDSFIF